jgi:rhamnogalacturonyl hydrolase YesR
MAKKKQAASATPQQIDAEREQRVAARDRVAYSYTVFWTKTARLWDATKREAVAQQLAESIASADFDANFYQRTYTLIEVDGAHSGASLLALQKVLQALHEA